MATKKRSAPSKGRRAAVVAGLRTPFVKSNGVFSKLTALDMASRVVSELIARANLPVNEIDRVVFGQVVASVATPNIAREVVLSTGLPYSVDAYSVSRACATSTQSITEGAMAIEAGDADIVICGGAEALSKPPITFSDRFVEILMKANSAKRPIDKAKAFLSLKPRDLLPNPPAIAEFSTGETMGDSAEKMAKENEISREDQDKLAARSHANAAKAWNDGIYDTEVLPFPVSPEFKQTVERDNLVRPDTNYEKLARLRPAFDRKHGSVTAGNASPLTDGASAVVLMAEEKAASLGYEALAFIKSWGYAGVDPAWQLLMGPAFAAPIALDRAGMKLADVDLVDMHEAFAAQVLSNMQAFASKSFAEERLGRSEAIGEVDVDTLNIYGGSLSLGHPFAATGARQVLTMANELNRRGGGTALITQCAAGGLGAAMIIEK